MFAGLINGERTDSEAAHIESNQPSRGQVSQFMDCDRDVERWYQN
jgi:hypothetical protein